MPSRNTHVGIAIILAIIISFILYKLNLTDFVTYLIPMYITSVLPDILEPAIDYKHRKFFHSKRILKFLSKYVLGIIFILALIFNFFFYFFFGVMGYILHLLLDATTPMGLPN